MQLARKVFGESAILPLEDLHQLSQAAYKLGYEAALAQPANVDSIDTSPERVHETSKSVQVAQPASVPAAVSGWKPIESAPTDGTFYLACDNESRWVENFPDGHYAGTWHWSDSRQQWRGHSHDDDREATHWMPIPPAPTGEPG